MAAAAMKIKTAWDDEEISFAGFGSAHAVSDYIPTKKPKRKFHVGFAKPTKAQIKAVLKGEKTRG